jgi:hypothetical protein
VSMRVRRCSVRGLALHLEHQSELFHACRYQVCLFCLQRLQQEYGNRCPGCRTVYGTDRDEWERQAEARAKELQAQRPPASPRAASRPSPRGPDASASPGLSPGGDDAVAGHGGERFAAEIPTAAATHPGTSRMQAADERADEHAWPSLSQMQGRAHASTTAARGAAQQQPASDNGNRGAAQSVNQHVFQTNVPRQRPGLPLPVTVQSMLNGTSTSLDTVIDLSPVSEHLQTYVARDLSPLIDQLKALRTNDKAAKKPAANAAQKPGSSAMVAPFSAAKRRPGAAMASGLPQAPPGLERRPANAGPARQAAPPAAPVASSNLWPQPAASEVPNRHDTLTSAFNQPPPGAVVSSTAPGAPGIPMSVTGPPPQAAASLAAPPGLAPPPGLRAGPPIPGPVAHAAPAAAVQPPGLSMSAQAGELSAAVLPAAAPARTSNILHELFPREKSGRLGWFAAPAPTFEGNMQQLWDSSAPLSTLVHPTLSSTRNRRPLYARHPDNVPAAIGDEAGCGAPPGLERNSSRDPIVGTLSRKLGGRAAEIGANLQ